MLTETISVRMKRAAAETTRLLRKAELTFETTDLDYFKLRRKSFRI
jgi:hypothetical protein